MSIPPISSSSSQPPESQASQQPPSSYKAQTESNSDTGGDHVVMGMHMNDKEYKQFMKNLQKSISDQISQNQADWQRNQDEIKQMEQEEGD